MALGLKQAREPKALIEERIKEATRILELGDYLKRRPAELSGGQRQRVAIGRAIVRQPKLFLFDEPLSNLDAALRMQTRVEIANLHRTIETTMVYVTHDQIEAMTLATKIVVLRDGVIEQVGTPMALYNKPANKFVAGFIGSPAMNFLPGEKAGMAQVATVGIRPEHIQIENDGRVPGTVNHIERLGGDTNVFVKIGGDQLITVRLFGQHDYDIGANVGPQFADADCHLFDAQDQRLPE
jgi:multiple sugar transport system ATP-binding protein